MPERRGRDERAEADPLRDRRERRERRPGIEGVRVGPDDRRVVIRPEEPLEAVLLGQVGKAHPVVPGDAFLALDHQADAHHDGNLLGLGDGRLAREALTDVDSRLPTHERLPRKQRHLVRRADRHHRPRLEGIESRARDGRVDVADDRDLARGTEPEIEPAQHPREEARCPPERRLREPEHRDGMPLELVVAPDPRQPQQDVGEHRVSRRNGRVLEVLRARHARVSVLGREEEPTVLGVLEELDREQRKPPGLEQPAELARRDVELDQPVRDVRVVVEEAEAARTSVACRAEKAAVLGRQRAEQELTETACSVEPIHALEPVSRFRERGEREAVPRRERLVVAEWLLPGVSAREHSVTQLGVELTADDEPPVLERLEELPSEADRLGFLRRPRVCQPLDTVRVRVLRGREPAVRERQLAQHVVDGLLDDLPIALALRDDPGMEIRGGEDRVVVEHLLEVRDEPAVVHGVAMEAASDDVVEAARRHPVECRRDHRQRALVPASEEELERRGGGELRRAAEAAEGRLERRGYPARRLGEERGRQRLGRRRGAGGRAQGAVDALGLALDVVAPLSPRLRDGPQELGKARDPVAWLRREVRAGVERPPGGRHEHRRRPAARPGHPDRRLHRHGVDVGPLLAIDLHVDEELVHERGRRGALERLVRHDVAPVAGAVPDGDEERLVLGAGSLEGLVTPLVPVDRDSRRAGGGTGTVAPARRFIARSVRVALSASARCEMIPRHEENIYVARARRRRRGRPRRPLAGVHDRGVRPRRRRGCAWTLTAAGRSSSTSGSS